MDNKELAVVDQILSSCNYDKTSLTAIMQGIQQEYRYLPRWSLDYISEKLDISPAKVFSVATFYENFSLSPKGKFVIRVCDGTACHVRKSIPVLNALRNNLGLREGKETTDDLLFTVQTVSCIGACGLAPVISVNNDAVYPAMTPEKVATLLDELRKDVDASE